MTELRAGLALAFLLGIAFWVMVAAWVLPTFGLWGLAVAFCVPVGATFAILGAES